MQWIEASPRNRPCATATAHGGEGSVPTRVRSEVKVAIAACSSGSSARGSRARIHSWTRGSTLVSSCHGGPETKRRSTPFGIEVAEGGADGAVGGDHVGEWRQLFG